MATPDRSPTNPINFNKALPLRPAGVRSASAKMPDSAGTKAPLTPSMLLSLPSSIRIQGLQGGQGGTSNTSDTAVKHENTNMAHQNPKNFLTLGAPMLNLNSESHRKGEDDVGGKRITTLDDNGNDKDNDDDDDKKSTRPPAPHRCPKPRGHSVASMERSLTSRVAMIVYLRDQIPGTESTCRQNAFIHLSPEVLDLFFPLEPPPRTPRAVLLILSFLKNGPGAASEKWKTTHAFVAELERLRNRWLMAMCDYYGLLAYLEACEVWNVTPISPHSEASGGPQWQGKIRMNSDDVYLTTGVLERFKAQPTFQENYMNMHLARRQMQAEERAQRKRYNEARIRAEFREQRRKVVKARNTVAVERQLGHSLLAGEEMSDGHQQGVLDMMEKIVRGEIEEA